MKYALVNSDGLVVNIILWDGTTSIETDGLTTVELPYVMDTDDDGNEFKQYTAGKGYTYDGTDWTAPVE